MRYQLTHLSRRTMAVTFLLLGVTALAAAAARVSMSVQERTDIELRTPAPPRVADRAQPVTQTQVAPLFAALGARSGAVSDETLGGNQAITGAPAQSGRRLNAPAETRMADGGQFRDFAGERSRRPSAGGGSGGSGAFGGGGIGGINGGGFGGGASKALARDGEATSAAAGQTSAAATSAQSASGGGSNSSAAGGALVGAGASTTGPEVPAAATSNVPAGVLGLVVAAETAPLPGNGPSPSGTPEPLTLLLVGSGLVGLYSARKHIAG